MYPPIVLGHVSRCIQRQRHTFKLNYRDLSHTYLVQCTYTVVYVVVSDTSATSHEPIVMYPPIGLELGLGLGSRLGFGLR